MSVVAGIGNSFAASYTGPVRAAEVPASRAAATPATAETSSTGGVDQAGASKRRPARDVEADFLKEIRKTPIERLREQVLKQLGLTEEALAAMEPKDRGPIEELIAKAIAERLKAAGGEPGQVIDRAA